MKDKPVQELEYISPNNIRQILTIPKMEITRKKQPTQFLLYLLPSIHKSSYGVRLLIFFVIKEKKKHDKIPRDTK